MARDAAKQYRTEEDLRTYNDFLDDVGIEGKVVAKIRGMMQQMNRSDLEKLLSAAERENIKNAQNPIGMAINRIRVIEREAGRATERERGDASKGNGRGRPRSDRSRSIQRRSRSLRARGDMKAGHRRRPSSTPFGRRPDRGDSRGRDQEVQRGRYQDAGRRRGYRSRDMRGRFVYDDEFYSDYESYYDDESPSLEPRRFARTYPRGNRARQSPRLDRTPSPMERRGPGRRARAPRADERPTRPARRT